MYITKDKTWFYINALSNELHIYVKQIGSKNNLVVDCDFYVQCLFKRVK